MIERILRKALKSTTSGGLVGSKEKAIPLSMQNGARLLYFYEHLRSIHSIEGSIVECGVGWGRSLLALLMCQDALRQNRVIYGFDSFAGFPDPTSEDRPGKATRGHYETNQASVITFLSNSGVDSALLDSNIKIIPGFFSEVMGRYDGGQVALLHLDVDLYTSYKETLEFFYPIVAVGGIIAFDEYQSDDKYPGAKKAIDEFFSRRAEKIFKSNIIDRYYTVKI